MIKKTLITIFLILFIIGFYLVDFKNNEVNFQGQIDVIIVYEDYLDTQTIQFDRGDTLLLILEKNFVLEYEHYLGLGNMIIRIDDLIQSDGHYIVMFVNDEFATTGVDLIQLEHEMVIRFELW